MVRPGLINLDFADVETVMSSMGKAMMGTGEAEGENRATVATEMALNNPLIDDYSLRGAKGLLVNITGGKDITLFEVDQAVQKVRAEVDPEAELIFGAIKDESLNGKMRVSIVATALDGQTSDARVLNMVNGWKNRIQNRNTGYSDSLFPKNTNIDNNTFGSIDGATALKLDEQFETNENKTSFVASEPEIIKTEVNQTDVNKISGVSIENASYMENNFESEPDLSELTLSEVAHEEKEEYTPQLFSEDSIEKTDDHREEAENNKLFDQDINEEEDFEIPAFLRRQKF
jgi:cell division protein FtsZ